MPSAKLRRSWAAYALTALVGVGVCAYFWLSLTGSRHPDPATGRIYEVPARYYDFYVDRLGAEMLWAAAGVTAVFLALGFVKLVIRRLKTSRDP